MRILNFEYEKMVREPHLFPQQADLLLAEELEVEVVEEWLAMHGKGYELSVTKVVETEMGSAEVETIPRLSISIGLGLLVGQEAEKVEVESVHVELRRPMQEEQPQRFSVPVRVGDLVEFRFRPQHHLLLAIHDRSMTAVIA